MAAPPAVGTKLSYIPEPQERAYYSGLFLAADTEKSGKISGQQAVQFFARSKLPMEALKNVWTVADNPPTNYLDPPKFATAVRLIQFVQNKAKGQGANLATPPGVTLRPAFFEGVTGVSVQPPPTTAAGTPPASPTGGPQPPPIRAATPPPRAPTPNAPGAGTPPRPPTVGPTTALATQDPYILTPNEQARYEDLFPKYAKEDGYCYGPAAVELFSKSGVPQQQLAAIWNMVDAPVDNRLDKLEFAMAMHLIVCVSRKNLPMPPSLPPSLQQLKAQQPPAGGQGGGPPPIQRVATQDSMSAPPMPPRQPSPQPHMGAPGGPPMAAGGGPPPLPSMGGPPPPPPPPRPQPAAPMPPPPSPSMASSSMPGPPPLDKTGGMSISDAFEGLSMSGGIETAPPGSGGRMPPPSMGFAQTAPPPASPVVLSMNAPLSLEEASPESPKPVSRSIPAPVSLPPAAAAAASPSPAESYQMGTATEEALKLKATLQKLQAENISLKAQLGSMTEEELQVQKEVNATVAEIAKLSNELTTLRAQVLAAKSRLLEATAELKANHEKKQVVKDLIAEAAATKQAIESAVDGIETYMNEEAKAPPAPAPVAEEDLFGFGPPPGQGSLPSSSQSLPPPVANTPDPYASGNSYVSEPPPALLSEPAPAPEPAVVETVDSGYSIPEPEGMASPPEPTLSLYHAPPPPTSSQPPAHRRDNSAFGSDFVMGGTALPSAPYAAAPAPLPAYDENDHDHLVMGSPSMGSVKSVQEINELKMKAKEAEDLARDAQEGTRQKQAQVNELRRLADEANAEARKLADQGKEPKKKGFMGRKKGKPTKKDVKEAERVAADAKEKNDKLMAAQAELKDSESLAKDTKREAERLRHEVEEAEIAAASHASMQDSKPPQPTPPVPQTNGYPGGPPAYGGVPPPPPQQQPYYGGQSPYSGQSPYGVYGQPPPPPAQDGYGYNPNVMGSGEGLSIPTPQAGDYDNPFSS